MHALRVILYSYSVHGAGVGVFMIACYKGWMVRGGDGYLEDIASTIVAAVITN
jgi:hypothetical protein